MAHAHDSVHSRGSEGSNISIPNYLRHRVHVTRLVVGYDHTSLEEIISPRDCPVARASPGGENTDRADVQVVHLEADALNNSDSVIGADLEYHSINNRGYHRDEKYYYLPSDEGNLADLQDYQLRLKFAGKRYFAPNSEAVKRVLDVGTGTGVWAIEFGIWADDHPDGEVFGVDVAANQPTFDLTPGGWLAVIDPTFPAKSDYGTLKLNSDLDQWDQLTCKDAARLGRPFDEGVTHETRLIEQDLINAMKRASSSLPIPGEAPKYKETGPWTLANIERNLESISTMLFCMDLA
ncbi:methyltransferase [Fusarium heterosporum]|uniref:Methyltransferase n=1 Tax=Fusarium heterosporum TaxID=42747 RepID=A0A8H5TUR7_FUSHE|nr:methyltransferase [Fusarium heterosporum]